MWYSKRAMGSLTNRGWIIWWYLFLSRSWSNQQEFLSPPMLARSVPSCSARAPSSTTEYHKPARHQAAMVPRQAFTFGSKQAVPLAAVHRRSLMLSEVLQDSPPECDHRRTANTRSLSPAAAEPGFPCVFPDQTSQKVILLSPVFKETRALRDVNLWWTFITPFPEKCMLK